MDVMDMIDKTIKYMANIIYIIKMIFQRKKYMEIILMIFSIIGTKINIKIYYMVVKYQKIKNIIDVQIIRDNKEIMQIIVILEK